MGKYSGYCRRYVLGIVGIGSWLLMQIFVGSILLALF
jgi:hypothetical protein